MTDKPHVSEKLPVLDPKTGSPRSDEGRRVLISSVGGALTKEKGHVVEGPYLIIFYARKKKYPNAKDPKKRKVLVEAKFITNPYWLVRLKANGFYLHFSEQEIKFV